MIQDVQKCWLMQIPEIATKKEQEEANGYNFYPKASLFKHCLGINSPAK